MVPTLVENSKFFVNFSLQNKIILTGELRILHQKKEMVPHAPATNYCLKSVVSIMLRCQLHSASLHSITNQDLFEKHLCNQSK